MSTERGHGDDMTIRRATPGDGGALRRLAALAESDPLRGDVLLVEVGDELWAAVDLATGREISDPFRPTLPARRLLRLRRESLALASGRVGRLRALRERLA